MPALTENQIPLDAQDVTFRPGVQSTDHPLVVTISPERLARSIELDASTSYRDAFALAWAATGIPDVGIPQHIADLEAEARNLRDQLAYIQGVRANERQLLIDQTTELQRSEGRVAQLTRSLGAASDLLAQALRERDKAREIAFGAP